MVESKKNIVVTDTHSVECHGKDFPYDHPIIYLEIPDYVSNVVCPYCSKTFVLK